jgi:hypothetical protein
LNKRLRAVCGFDSGAPVFVGAAEAAGDPSMSLRRNQNTRAASRPLRARCVQQIPAARFMGARSHAFVSSPFHLREAKYAAHGFFACTATADAAATADATLCAEKKQPAELWTCLLELQYRLVEFFSSLVGSTNESAFSFMLLVMVYVFKMALLVLFVAEQHAWFR